MKGRRVRRREVFIFGVLVDGSKWWVCLVVGMFARRI